MPTRCYASGSSPEHPLLRDDGNPPRLRTDVLGSLKLGEWEVAGGAWATQGLARGGEPGFWTQPGVRQKVTLPIPFLRDSGAGR
jgi:hypothetical protein